MRKVVEYVQSGKFAEEWIAESRSGAAKLKALMEEMNEHQLEKVGRFIRKTAGLEK